LDEIAPGNVKWSSLRNLIEESFCILSVAEEDEHMQVYRDLIQYAGHRAPNAAKFVSQGAGYNKHVSAVGKELVTPSSTSTTLDGFLSPIAHAKAITPAKC